MSHSPKMRGSLRQPHKTASSESPLPSSPASHAFCMRITPSPASPYVCSPPHPSPVPLALVLGKEREEGGLRSGLTLAVAFTGAQSEKEKT